MAAGPQGSNDVGAPARMTARSVVLSVLLGAHPAWATAAELIGLTTDFDLKETTLRVALTRMVGAGDLVRSADGYRLSDRLLARQRRQDDALWPRRRSWDGTWTTLVITSVGVDARSRAGLRKQLQDSRFGELREGVWLRPDNLQPGPAAAIGERARVLHSVDDAPEQLARQLWDLPAWAATATDLLAGMAAADGVPTRFMIAAGMVRHLLTDPVLPEDLLPRNWPGDALREAYTEFAAELTARRRSDRPSGGGGKDMSGGVRVERSGRVITVIMNRPQARNAVNGPVAAELFDAFSEFDADDAASVAVLCGGDGTFCAGADLKAFGTPENRAHRTGPGPMGPTRIMLSQAVIAAGSWLRRSPAGSSLRYSATSASPRSAGSGSSATLGCATDDGGRAATRGAHQTQPRHGP